jgi:F-type H+-transporting ATPase subunit a
MLNPTFTKAESHEDSHGHEEKKAFDAGEMIIDHVVDAHDWHILTTPNGKHISVPLPIILYYDGQIDVFMSSKFHHGHDTYKGYMLVTEGEKKGKIVRVKKGTHEIDENAGTVLDFSITKNVFSLFFSLTLITIIFISVARAYTRREGMAPKGLQSFLEPLIIFVRDSIAKPSIGEKKYYKYMPFLLTVFFFIFFNNLLGLIPLFPGGANLTGNITITLALALMTFLITTFSGNKDYWKHIFNTPGVPWWLKFPVPLMPIVELMGVITKPFVLMVRLFANITAGHIIVLGFFSLIFIMAEMSSGAGWGTGILSTVLVVFMTLLEFLVAFIQAYVFTLLSALYFGLATKEHHDH